MTEGWKAVTVETRSGTRHSWRPILGHTLMRTKVDPGLLLTTRNRKYPSQAHALDSQLQHTREVSECCVLGCDAELAEPGNADLVLQTEIFHPLAHSPWEPGLKALGPPPLNRQGGSGTARA